ncbi:MAG: hypothetical protein ACEPO8_02815 [Rhodothermaceae bacterium]
MSINQNHIGFNITNSRLQLVEVGCEGSKYFIENIDEEYYNNFFDLSDKETKIITLLEDAFNELVLRKQLNTNNVSFTLPNKFFRILEIPYEETLLKEDLTESLKWNLSVLFPETTSDEYVIQHILVEDSKFLQQKNAIIIGINRKFLKILHKFCTRNNLVLRFIDNVHIASNTISLLHSEAEKNILNFYFEEKSFSVCLLENSKPIHFAVKKCNSANDIVDGLKAAYDKVNKIIPEENIDDYFISGENISAALCKQVNTIFGCDVKKLNPFHGVKTMPDLADNDLLNSKFSSFTASTGISIRIY